MNGPGTMTWEEFIEDVKRLVQVSDKIVDNWKLNGDENIPGGAYLSRQVKTFITPNCLASNKNTTDVSIRQMKDPFEAESEPEVPLIIEHHVLWSLSYSVPILLFNGWMSDFPGINPVSVESSQKLVNHHHLGYHELSQTIHPILGTTFLELHPCRSNELLQIISKSGNKLVSWLSTVAPAALNLRIKNEYFCLTKEPSILSS